jgi:hypothetical protein
MPPYCPIEIRIERLSYPEPNTGCRLWVGFTHFGYGIVNVDGKARRAHRVAWELAFGPIPDSLVVDHMCRVRCCINVDHLRIVDRRTNAIENSTSNAAVNAAKTHCPKCGLEYSIDYLSRYGGEPTAYRNCRPCAIARVRAWRDQRQYINGRYHLKATLASTTKAPT